MRPLKEKCQLNTWNKNDNGLLITVQAEWQSKSKQLSMWPVSIEGFVFYSLYSMLFEGLGFEFLLKGGRKSGAAWGGDRCSKE